MTRLDVELASRGLAASRSAAARLVDEGAVRVDGVPARRAAQPVESTARIEVDEGAARLPGRAAHKLAAALDAFDVDPAGRLALDVGASTGGFTRVLLDRGAREVTALDVGRDQLVPELRADPRVRVVEGVNARDLTPETLAAHAGTDEAPTLVVVDVSFIPLALVLPAIVASVHPDAELVVLVKPQFEVGRARIRDGVVRDPGHRRDAVLGVLDAAGRVGAPVHALIASPLTGAAGNLEYLAHLRVGRPASRSPEALVDALGDRTGGSDTMGTGRAPAPREGSTSR